MAVTATAIADTRYSFVGQYLEASTRFVRRLRTIECSKSIASSQARIVEHRGLVCAVVMQCTAALESETFEVCVHGPGSYLGSNGIDRKAQEFLAPLVDVVDKRDVIRRFELILHLLRKPTLPRGREPVQSAKLVVGLRNELVHYKSQWGQDMTRDSLLKALERRKHRPPPHTSVGMNFYPHRCLSADCAEWALRSVVAYLEAFYEALGVPSRFKTYRRRLEP